MAARDCARALEAHPPALIAIGASAGAVDALVRLLPLLPLRLAAPILLVVHLPPARENPLTAVLAAHCALPVEEADDKMPARTGSIYVAPSDYHLLIEPAGHMALSSDEPVNFSRPSIDVLFESAAYAYDRRVLGILLSGASADGAAGLALIRARGGLTWVQTPASASVAVMPEAALALAPHPVLDPEDMGRALAAWGRSHD